MITNEGLMKKLLATLFFSLCATITSAQVVNGSASAISGARWTITNSTVVTSDRFYVNLDNVTSNLLALDLVFNSQRFSRFSTYGDSGSRAGGTGNSNFSGYGYLLSNGSVNLYVTDSLGSGWNCYLEANLNGSCTVYTSSSRRLGEVRLNWNP